MVKKSNKMKSIINNRKTNKGITLIALVITIIVLLILAGVSIAMLTGDNGILTQANNAKTTTNEKNAEEAVKMEIAGSFDDNGKYNKDKAIENLKKNLKISEDDIIDNGDGTLGVKYDGYKFTVNAEGKVTVERKEDGGSTTKKISEVTSSYVGKNTQVEDEYGNIFMLPEGFKVRKDETTNNADTVDKGIVIEDREGNQFVWIPVGTFNKDKNGETKEEVILGIYDFASDGTPSNYTGNYKEADLGYGNAIAKDIEDFKSKANSNHGYYIGRYEAGVTNYDATKTVTSKSNSETKWTGYVATEGKNLKLVCKSGQQPWNYVTQNKASELSKTMYTGKTYESDLINSYAWDTTIVFIQKCGTKTNSKIYSGQIGKSTNTSVPSTTGTGLLKATNAVDEQCNIYDMAGNELEWSTETCSVSNYSCVYRGGNYYRSDLYTCRRLNNSTTEAYDYHSFRSLLYL